MLPFQVRRFAGRAGDEVIILTRRSGLPYFYPNVFVTSDFRNTGRADNTIAKVLRSIGMALLWADTNERDLDHDLAYGDFITVAEVDDLVRFLGQPAEAQVDEYLDRKRRVSLQRPNVVRLESFRTAAKILEQRPAANVHPTEAGARIRWVAKYAEWHLERRLHRLGVSGASSEPFKTNATLAIDRLRTLAPSASDWIDDDIALEAPDIEVIQTIENMLQPGSPRNPFRSPFIQYRNYLIWRLLLDTGGRRHEVQCARASDITYAQRRFSIVRSKSLTRTVAIRAKTATAYDDYVMNFWTKLPTGSPARVEGFLFCSENGKRLSLRGINRIFETVRTRVPSTPQKLSPHAMRRFWNYLFSNQVDEQPLEVRLSEREEIEYRKRIMGWSTDTQAKRYNKRHIKEAGDKLAQKMMDTLNNQTRGAGTE